MADTPEVTDTSPPPPPVRPHPPSKWRRKVLILLLLILAVPVVIFSLWAWVTLGYVYSTGERAGYVQKLSKKGWFCKTWEGEMAMVTIPGTLTEKFNFTVPTEAVATKVNTSIGKRVAVQYDQHKWIPSSCFGDTEYFVTDVHVAE